VFSSVQVFNFDASTGGGGGDTIVDIRNKALSTFSSQLRSVTQDDYLVRALSLPSMYGTLSKVYIAPEKLENLLPGETPSVLNLYVLAFNNKKQLTIASDTLKQNLSTYISQYRVINDSIKIKDAFYINIGIDFEIVVLPEYNNNEVLYNCIESLKTYFDIDKWQINEPIMLKDLYIMIDKIDGVQTVKNVNIHNLVDVSDVEYSQYAYDIKGATINNVIYPSLDPMIFEVRYPNNDIKGRVVPL
jgi:hypothetical protein